MKPLTLPHRTAGNMRLDGSLAIVNIVLLLLFFFLVAGQGMPSATGIEPSRTTTLALNRLPRPILVVRAPDDWELDGRPGSPELLSAAPGRPAPGGVLHLMIDRSAPAALLIETLNHPSLAGLRLPLVTIRDTAPGGGT